MKDGIHNHSWPAHQEAVQNQGTTEVLDDEVSDLVHYVLKKFRGDQIQMADYALKSAGASVIESGTSESYKNNKAKLYWHGIGFLNYEMPPDMILQPDVHPGKCWAFPGSQGHILIKLARKIIPTAVTMEHISEKVSPSGNTSSAPKEFSVYGMMKRCEGEEMLLGQFMYNKAETTVQTFELQDLTSPHPGCVVSVATATVGRRFAAFDPGERQAEPLRPHRNLSARARVSQSEHAGRDFRAPRAEAAAGQETAMKFRAKIVDLACLNHFTRVSNMIAKLAKTCTLRISPEKLNFILSDMLASGGVSMWCELEQENIFSEFQMEGVSAENNEIYLELTSENLSRALKTAQNARALNIKLTNKHFPCLTVSVELLSSSSSSRIVTHDIPIKVIPRRLWKDLQEPSVPDSDVSIYLPALKTMKSVVEKMKNISNHLVIEANLNGDLNLKIETELVCVTTHFKDLGNPVLPSESVSQNRHPEDMVEVHIDIRKLLQFLAGQQVTPTKAVCMSVGGGWRTECGVQHQQAQHTAEDITEDQKRVLQAFEPAVRYAGSKVFFLLTPPFMAIERDETPIGAGEKKCLQLCDCSPRSFCIGVPVSNASGKGQSHHSQAPEIQTKPEPCVNDEHGSWPPYVTAGDKQTQKPAPWDKNVLNASCEGRLSASNRETQAPAHWDGGTDSSSEPPPGIACTCSLPTSGYHPESPSPLTQHPTGPIPAMQPENTGLHINCFPDTDAPALPALGIRVHPASRTLLRLLVDFGDGCGAEMRLCPVTGAAAVTSCHRYRKEGVYKLRAVVHDVHGADMELGPYYVNIGHENVSVFMNSSSIHDCEALSLADSLPQQKGTVVTHGFSSVSSYNVSFVSQPPVGSGQAWLGVTVGYKMQSVSINTNGTVFAADTDITFVAVTKETIPLEFVWYHVMVEAISRIGSVVSESHLISVQKRIAANRLMSPASALVNANVSFECRLNFGTDVAYLWNFGDGTTEVGSSSSSHVYSREGEFTVEVLAFNNISSAILRKPLFIVHEPCQPPPVKNMGPKKVQGRQALTDTTSHVNSQIWRSQPLRLAATLEAAVLCNISQGLSYSWTIVDAEATAVTLPAAVNTLGQTIVLPSYTLECGNYTATAKVQIKGSMVYSNYCVGVEVRARAPVSVISEGTHVFIPRATTTSVILRGFQSYDPDKPGAALRYHWTCTAASSPRWPCFEDSTPYQVDTQAPAISFPAKWLNGCCDQFLVTLTVSSNGQNSSRALIFLSTRSDSDFRFVHISWVNFRDIRVNWNEELSLRAVCEDCDDIPDLTYSWDLFLVNATEKNTVEVVGPMAGSGEPMEDSSSLSPAPGSLDEEALMMSAPEGSWPFSSSSSAFDDFEAYYSDIQEDVPSPGRQPGTGTNFQESGPSMNAEESASDGDNLLGPFLHTGRAKPALMIDWPKALVSRAVFHSYTSSGIMGPAVTIRPFSLSSGEMYVFQASVASKKALLGKAQLYIMVNQVPQDMSCQVRPHSGLEAHTVFSVFCMSGKPDFHYEFRYQVGNTSPHTLYSGRDTQYYFLLPAGETTDNYKVIFSTEITDGQGSKVQPCSVEVTVLPRYHGNDCPDKDLYDSTLDTLSSLQLVGSYTEVRNYIVMTTVILSRLYVESRNTSTCGLWSQIQDVLISSACRVPLTDQLSFMSAVHILEYAQILLAQGPFSRKLLVNKNLGAELILLISGVWEAAKEDGRKEDSLQEEGMKIISDMLLTCLSLGHQHQFHISAGKMEFWTLLHHSFQKSSQNLGLIWVHFPGELALRHPVQEASQSPCYISQLMLFMNSPYPEGRAPGQVGSVVSPLLYSCKDRSRILRGRLETPVTVEFGEEDYLTIRLTCSLAYRQHQRHPTVFTLLRDEVNLHRFTGLSEKPQEILQICIKFLKLRRRAFPVLLLVRFSKKATPSDFLVKQVYFWDKQTVQIYVPALPWKGADVGYLSLLDADYDRRPPNKYLAGAVNYTVHFQWIQCVFWDKTEWRSEGPCPQPGTSPERVNCSYLRLAPFSVLRRKLNATFEVSSISEFRSDPHNLLPGIFSVFLLVLYGILVTKSRCIRCHKKRKPGCIFLEGDTTPGHQLYAVIVDTGFRSPAQFTSKVFIVLCGENGLSDTKELCCPEMSLFGRNSRHTFILSTPNQLGPLQKIHLWHDSSGPAPNWFVSHVMVKELHSGQGWFFSAQCWLAVSLCDGRVQRELFCLRRGLGFWKLFYAKFTEYLEDFHIWLSLYSQPPSSSYLHTQRVAVAFCLLCVYSCLTALVTVGVHEQRPLDVGPTLESFCLGLLCTFLACPAAQLLSLLFRFSKEATEHLRGAPQWSLRGVKTEVPQAPSSGFEGRVPQWSRVCLRWSSSVVWAICGLASLACGLGTGFLGYRFVTEQCIQWLHLLLLSVVCCVFVTQPLMICLAALAFAWKKKHDSQFFTESLHDATKDLDLELEEHSRTHLRLSPNSHSPDTVEEAERVLAARQRDRRLRWAQPPSRAKFREIRERLRKENWMQAALRNDRHSFGDLNSTDDWWDWTLSMLLDGLHPEGPSVGVRGAQPPRPVSEPAEDAPPTLSRNLDLENLKVTPSGPEACGAMKRISFYSLGRTRHEVHVALTALRTSRWIDHSTRAVSVHFTLYNPPTRLFTSVTLGAELLPTGGLVPSSLVESISIYGDSAPRYLLMLSELAFLVLNVTYFCFQLWGMTTKGVLSYWRKPRHWLELSTVGVALAYHAASGHLTTLAKNVTDQFHKGLHQMFVDLSLVVSWNQDNAVSSQMVALEALRELENSTCAHYLGIHARYVEQNSRARDAKWTCSSMGKQVSASVVYNGLAAVAYGLSLSFSLTLSLLGALSLAAYSHLCRFLLFTGTPSPDTSTDAFPELLLQFLGRNQKDSLCNLLDSGRRAVACYCGALFLLVAALCFGMNYYLDEFSSLLDELLLKIDGLSDILELSSLENQWRRTVESGTEDSPLVGIPGSHATVVRLRKLFFNFLHSKFYILKLV
ncbi:Polycystic kidney disease protein 1-like 1 [Microtus ochrogaster]|uniref:Checkpoint protein HUS1 n=1 Tax=Microtus ochrogaster TaxID=79684 RepID=A0A8J6L5M1_MICOH|nr:Polycystic kidney disease protein 1-like 1 [Microtus ochrogaster]